MRAKSARFRDISSASFAREIAAIFRSIDEHETNSLVAIMTGPGEIDGVAGFVIRASIASLC